MQYAGRDAKTAEKGSLQGLSFSCSGEGEVSLNDKETEKICGRISD